MKAGSKVRNMPIIKSAKKAMRVSLRRKKINQKRKDSTRVVLKKIRVAIKEKNKEEGLKLLPLAYKAFDKAAKTGVIKKNTASRKKSRISKLVNSTFK